MSLQASAWSASKLSAVGPKAAAAKPQVEAALRREPQSRLDHVDLLKGFAIVGVVLHHVAIRSLGSEVVINFSVVVHAFSWAVYAFIFLAGYLHCRSTKVTSGWRFITTRARRLLVPYLILGVSFATVRELLIASPGGSLMSERKHGFWAGIQSLASVDTGGIFGQQLYFYPVLFFISCLFLGIWSMAVTRRRAALVVGGFYLAIVGLVLTGHHISNTGASRTMILAGVTQYALGYLFADTERARRAWSCTAVTMFAIGVLSLLFLGREALLVLAAPLLLTLAFQRLAVGDSPMLRPLRQLGHASSVIFAYHTPFVLFPQVVLLQRLHVPPYINIIIAFLNTLIICWSIWYVAGRVPALRFLRV